MIEGETTRGSQRLLLVVAVLAVGTSLTLGAWILLAPDRTTLSSRDTQALRSEVRDLESQVQRLRTRLDSLESRYPSTGFPSSDNRRTVATKDRERDRAPRRSSSPNMGSKPNLPAGPLTMAQLVEIQDVAERRVAVAEHLASLGFWDRANAIKELMAVDPEQALEATHRFLEAAKEEWKGDWGARTLVQSLAEVLGQVEGYSIANDLYRIYESEIPGVPMVAARALERQGDPSLVLREIERSAPGLHSTDTNEQIKAIREIGSTRSPSALPYLTPMLGNPNWEIRVQTLDVMTSLATIGEISILEPLLNDPVTAVRDQAMRTIRILRNRSTQED